MLSKKITIKEPYNSKVTLKKKKKKESQYFKFKNIFYKYLAVILVGFSVPGIFNKRSAM